MSFTIQIHGFCDASENAYAAVTYLRIESATAIKVSYLMAKTRVAPVKPVSIPRLELMAAHSLAKLVRYVLGCVQDTKDYRQSILVVGFKNRAGLDF